MDEKELFAAINNCLAQVTAARRTEGREAKEWALAAAVLIDKLFLMGKYVAPKFPEPTSPE